LMLDLGAALHSPARLTRGGSFPRW
jgi:hypothetical protein